MNCEDYLRHAETDVFRPSPMFTCGVPGKRKASLDGDGEMERKKRRKECRRFQDARPALKTPSSKQYRSHKKTVRFHPSAKFVRFMNEAEVPLCSKHLHPKALDEEVRAGRKPPPPVVPLRASRKKTRSEFESSDSDTELRPRKKKRPAMGMDELMLAITDVEDTCFHEGGSNDSSEEGNPMVDENMARISSQCLTLNDSVEERSIVVYRPEKEGPALPPVIFLPYEPLAGPDVADMAS